MVLVTDSDPAMVTVALVTTSSRTARCTPARSSDVALVQPTSRDPCPAVVSRTVLQPYKPMSFVHGVADAPFGTVELVPAGAGVDPP